MTNSVLDQLQQMPITIALGDGSLVFDTSGEAVIQPGALLAANELLMEMESDGESENTLDPDAGPKTPGKAGGKEGDGSPGNGPETERKAPQRFNISRVFRKMTINFDKVKSNF